MNALADFNGAVTLADVMDNKYLLSVVNEMHYDKVKREMKEIDEYENQVRAGKIKAAQRALRGR